jgi:hypothetical protein
MNEKHCKTCICGRRAPVQESRPFNRAQYVDDPTRGLTPELMEKGKGPGTVSWEEHCLAWSGYAMHYGRGQSAERMAERGGFSYFELCDYLGHEPKTWTPR